MCNFTCGTYGTGVVGSRQIFNRAGVNCHHHLCGCNYTCCCFDNILLEARVSWRLNGHAFLMFTICKLRIRNLASLSTTLQLWLYKVFKWRHLRRMHYMVVRTFSASNSGTQLVGPIVPCLWDCQLHGVSVMQHSRHRLVLFLGSSIHMILWALHPCSWFTDLSKLQTPICMIILW